MILTKHHPFQAYFQIFENGSIIFANILGRNAGNFGHHSFDFFDADGFAPFAFRHKMLGRARLINHVDSFIGQFAVGDIARRQLNCGFDRISGVFDAVMVFKIAFDAAQDFNRIIHAWFIHVDFLKTAAERAVFFKMLAVFFVGG